MTFCWQDGGRRDNVSLPSAQYDEMVALPMLFVMFYQLRTTLKCFLTTKCIPWSSSITMYQLTSNHQLCHFIFPQLLTSCWTSLPSFLISLNGSYISTPSFFSPTFITCISIHSVPLLQCSNDSPFSLWSIPKLEAGGTQKCRIVHSFLWRIFKLSDAVWRYATYQLLQRLLLIYTSQNVYMPCLLLLSNEPIRHVYVYYFNHHILQSTTQVTLENPVWYIQQRFHAGLPFHAPFSSCGRWYVFLLDLADLPYLLPSAQFSMTILTFYRDDA